MHSNEIAKAPVNLTRAKIPKSRNHNQASRQSIS